MPTGTAPWPQVPIENRIHNNAGVVIIGAGIAGMCTAIDLIKQNIHNFTIVERSSSIGGTWNDNKYPGCCCDVWSLLYSYSFEQNPNWTREYPAQQEILEYLIGVAEKWNLYKYIRFNTSVEEARWDDAENKWKVDLRLAQGTKEAEFSSGYTIRSDFLVSAVGQLNVPFTPKIPGLEDFKGKVMHSARWDWSYNMEGKRIAIIGNGATAVQIIPEVQKVASHVTVYQRTPNWVIPRGDRPTTALERTVYKYIPPIRWRKRALQMDFRESFYDAVWDGDSEFADLIRNWCTGMMKEALPGREDLWKILTPTYNPGCKRIVISDDYYPTLAKENVHLETRRISRITASGIEVTKDSAYGEGEGTESQDFDMIVLATGFRTVEFMHPIRITGAHGKSLSEVWSKGAQALYGVTIPSLPNFGMLYGPNTNLGHNSIVLMIEAQSRYINALIRRVIDARGAGKALSLTPKDEVVRRYNEELQDKLNKSSFADPRCGSWYKNAEGKILNNWSGNVIEYQELLSKVNWDDYDIGGSGKDLLEGKREERLGRVKEESLVPTWGLVMSGLGVLAVAGGIALRNSHGLAGRLRLR